MSGRCESWRARATSVAWQSTIVTATTTTTPTVNEPQAVDDVEQREKIGARAVDDSCWRACTSSITVDSSLLASQASLVIAACQRARRELVVVVVVAAAAITQKQHKNFDARATRRHRRRRRQLYDATRIEGAPIDAPNCGDDDNADNDGLLEDARRMSITILVSSCSALFLRASCCITTVFIKS